MSYFNKDFYGSEFFKEPHFNNEYYDNPFFTGWVWARTQGGAVTSPTVIQVPYDKTLVGSVSATKVKVWVNGVIEPIDQPTISGNVLSITLTAGAITPTDTVEIELTHSQSNNLTGITKSVLVNNVTLVKAL